MGDFKSDPKMLLLAKLNRAERAVEAAKRQIALLERQLRHATGNRSLKRFIERAMGDDLKDREIISQLYMYAVGVSDVRLVEAVDELLDNRFIGDGGLE